MMRIYKIALGLLPISLCFWYYQTLVGHPVEKVYFLYTDGLIFLSDALALVVVLTWGLTRLQSPPGKPTFSLTTKLGFLFCLLTTLSALWADDWQVALFVSLHLWLVFGLFLSVKDHPESWRALAAGACIALLVQIVIGFGQFALQTTAFLRLSGLEWPGQITPEMRGASVVELANGMRWLRVYGSLPHPNILGGFTLFFLYGPTAFLLFEQPRRLWTLALLAGGAALMILTFSRSAWVGLVAAGLVLLLLQRRKLPIQRVAAAGLSVLVGILSTALPLYQLIFTRTEAKSTTEEFSNSGRVWLTEQAINMIRAHPLLGVGVGNFIVEYARHVPTGYLLEPVHNLPLLLIAELGLPGALLSITLVIVILRKLWHATSNPQAILFSAMLVGLLTLSLFDHYLWTLAPGRMLLGLAFGLWAAQSTHIKNAISPNNPKPEHLAK